jgi:hypothetical protein
VAKKTRKKKAASRPKASKRASRDRYAHAESEIIGLVIAPRIRGLWNEGLRTPAALRTAYNDRFTTGHGDISEAAFKGWLTACGFTRQPSALSAPETLGRDLSAPAPTALNHTLFNGHMTREQAEAAGFAIRRNGSADPLYHDGDIDAPLGEGDGPEPMLTPPPDVLPGEPGYVLANPHA